MHARSISRAVTLASAALLAGCLYDSGGSFIQLTDDAREGITRSAFGAVETGRIDDLDEFFTDDYTRTDEGDPDGNVSSLDEYKAYLRQREQALSFEEIILDEVHVNGNKVSFEGRYELRRLGEQGELRPDSPRVSVPFLGTHRFVNGKIARTWISWDEAEALRQLQALDDGSGAP